MPPRSALSHASASSARDFHIRRVSASSPLPVTALIADTSTPLGALPDGPLATIRFTSKCQPEAAVLRFSSQPTVSFGNAAGQSVPGEAVVLPQAKLLGAGSERGLLAGLLSVVLLACLAWLYRRRSIRCP